MSYSRRTFLKTSAAAAATAVAARRLSAAPLTEPIGLQLYSVRELLPKDFDGTLHQLAAAGYVEVEAAGYFGRTAADFRHSMDQAGLRCISTHYAMGMLRPRVDELIEYAHNVGCSYIVCPSPTRKDPAAHGPLDLEDWRWAAGELNRIGEKVKAAGMSFGYHNHTPEFGTENGVVFYDELLRLTDPKLVFFEMDCGWVFAAGRNPVDYLSKTPARFPLHPRQGHGQRRKRPVPLRHPRPGRHGLQTHPPRRDGSQALLHRAGRILHRHHGIPPPGRRLHAQIQHLVSFFRIS